MPDRNGAFQRIGVLAQLPALLSELGVDPVPVFRDFALDPDTLDPEHRLPFVKAVAIIERAACRANRPDLGLLLGNRGDHRLLGLVGEMMDCAPTLGRALGEYVSVQGGLSHAASAYLMPMGDLAALGFGVYDRFAPGSEHFYAVAMAMSMNCLRRLTGGQIEVVEVHFSHRAPADPRSYERVLRARVCFNREQTAILFSRPSFRLANPNADAQRHAGLVDAVAAMLRLSEAGMAQRLRHQLRPALSLGDAGLATLARRLGMSARTLNRRLADENTSFSAQRDAVRFVMACELLARTDLSIGDISLALTYANHSAFVRSFRRWNSSAPTEWRRAQAAALSDA